MLERSGLLKIATVGDCGLRIVRKGNCTNFSFSFLLFFLLLKSCLSIPTELRSVRKGNCTNHVCFLEIGQIVFTTSPQEHYFDCPYQLSSETVSQTYVDATV